MQDSRNILPSKGFTCVVLILLLCLCTGDPDSSRLVTCKQSRDTAANQTSVTCDYSGNTSDVTSYDVIAAPTKTSSEREYKHLLSCAVKSGEVNCKNFDCEGYQQRSKWSVIANVSSSKTGIFGCYYALTSKEKVTTFCIIEEQSTAPSTVAISFTTEAENIGTPKGVGNWAWNSLACLLLAVLVIIFFLELILTLVFAKRIYFWKLKVCTGCFKKRSSGSTASQEDQNTSLPSFPSDNARRDYSPIHVGYRPSRVQRI